MFLDEVTNGYREIPVDETPPDYKELYAECWHADIDTRPLITEVVQRLDKMMSLAQGK